MGIWEALWFSKWGTGLQVGFLGCSPGSADQLAQDHNKHIPQVPAQRVYMHVALGPNPAMHGAFSKRCT